MSRTPLVFSLDAPFKLSKRYRMAAFGGIVITSIIVLTSTLSNLGPVSKLDLAELEGYKSRWKTYIPDTFKFEGFTLGGSGVPCDPLLQPGFTNAGTGAWETLNPECPGENFARPIRDTPEDELWDAFPEFRNKSILFAGDSVGRHLFEWFCFLGKTGVALSFPPGFENIQYGPSSYCTITGLGMKVAQIHTYSLTNTSDPYALDIVQKWFPGGKDWDLRSRVDRFFETTLQDFQPDYIQLNSGPWDFRYWFLRDNIEGIRQDDLALEDREEAAAVAVQALDYFQAKFSGAKVWYMHPPMADENDYRAKMIVADPVLGLAEGKSLKPEEYPPFYTYRRQAQYRATMRQRIAEAGHDSLDYAQIQQVISPALFYKPGDAIHPQEKAKWAMSNMILTKMAQYARYGV